MGESSISRSTYEAYGAIFLTLFTVLCPMTWWVCLLFVWVILCMALHVIISSDFGRLNRHKTGISFIVLPLIGFCGILRAENLYDAASLSVEKFGSFPEATFSLTSVRSTYRPLLILKSVEGSIINYSYIYTNQLTNHILDAKEEYDSMIGSLENRVGGGQIKEKEDNVQNILANNETVKYFNLKAVVTDNDLQNIVASKSYLYAVVLIKYQSENNSKTFFARYCALLLPQNNGYLPCKNVDFVKKDNIKGH